MALVKWSALVGDVRGKINGTVFARNRYGAFARNKVTPSNPQTPRQLFVRAMFAQLSQQWRNLTQDQRDAWNRAVNDFLDTNIFGDTVKPNGLNLFIRININLQNIGQPTVKFPPVPVMVDAIRIIQFKLEAATKTIDITIESRPDTTHTPTVFATRSLSPGITYARQEYRMIDFTSDPIGPNQYVIHLGPEWVSKYGPLTDYLGRRLFFKITPIDIKTGLNGISITFSEIIA